MTGITAPIVESFILDKLVNDTTLLAITVLNAPALGASTPVRIWRNIAAQDAPPPYVVYQFSSAVPLKTLGRIIVWSDCIYTVKAFDRWGDIERIVPIVNRIDQILSWSKGTAVGGEVLFCQPESEVSYPEDLGNGVFGQHLGRQYRFYGR